MFKLFKKTLLNKENVITDVSVNVSKASYPKEVLEIHHEFEIASDKLLNQAKQCIAEAESKDVVKISRLQSLGFKQAAQVVEIEPIIKKAELSKEQISLVQHYKQKYPLNKFITEEQVKEICYKYNLICGDVSRFKGFVPEKNLKEIERFKLNILDDTNPKLGEIYIILNDWSLLNVNDIKVIKNKEDFNSLIKNFLTKHDYSYVGNESISGYKYNLEIKGWGKIFQYRLDNLKDSDIVKAIERNKKTLQICAPLKDMDITDLDIEENYKLKNKYKDIPDPVVLQPVKGGYLILTAWGDEQYDPLVFNEINN